MDTPHERYDAAKALPPKTELYFGPKPTSEDSERARREFAAKRAERRKAWPKPKPIGKRRGA